MNALIYGGFTILTILLIIMGYKKKSKVLMIGGTIVLIPILIIWANIIYVAFFT